MEIPEPVVAYIALGSNVGDRSDHLQQAVRLLSETPGIEVIAVSPIYESQAHTIEGAGPAADFLNAVLALSTDLSPRQLLQRLFAIEDERGRHRSPDRRWAPRTLDLDLLHYADALIDEPGLQVPHPRLAERRFVLQPLADLAPNLVVAEPFGETVSALLESCPDGHPVRRVADPPAVPGRDALPQGELWPSGMEQSIRRPVTRLPEELRYIVVEGVIGAGKTTLARLISERFGARMVGEQFEENPFLERFYEDRPRWAFQTQLSFLASRFRQQQSLARRDLFHEVIVSDYAFDKDRIFAQLNLAGDELQLYDTMYGIMQAGVPMPDVIVYLQSTTDRLMEQIRRRGRSYEKDMDREYINQLNQAYNDYFFHYDRSPLLIVNAARLDFVKNPADLEELLAQMSRVHHPGTTYFNPVRPA